MLAQNCKDFSSQNTMYNKDPDKAGTARRHLSSIIETDSCNVYSLEMSMLGYKPEAKSDKVIQYNEENCNNTYVLNLILDSLLQMFSRAGIFARLCGISTRSLVILRLLL